jgi:murein DD-endopeptidase MepM/ murein hydrolase activator NlpD
MKKMELVQLLKAHAAEFVPVVPFDPAIDKLAHMDMTISNKKLSPEMLNDIHAFNEFITLELKIKSARYGIGGYAEHRTIYSGSPVFDAASPDDEPRRFHLGIDIWGQPLTPVITPINGIVHSFGNNDNFGDYGATIILVHNIEGTSFYTLYGHLSLNSIKNIREGDRFNKGDVLGEFGIPSENGHWPPHLHFQVINNIGAWQGDYPGVCKFSEREAWLANCPDPDLILQLEQFA